MQSIAIRALADGESQSAAGRLAGYSAPAVAVCTLMQKTAARDAVRKLQEGQKVLLGQKALSKLDRMLDDEGLPAAVKRNVIRDALEVAGHIKNRQQDERSPENRKNPEEMSYQEIMALASKAAQRMEEIKAELGTTCPDQPPAMLEHEPQTAEDKS